MNSIRLGAIHQQQREKKVPFRGNEVFSHNTLLNNCVSSS